MTRQPWTPEARAAYSQRQRQRCADPAYIENMRRKALARYADRDFKVKWLRAYYSKRGFQEGGNIGSLTKSKLPRHLVNLNQMLKRGGLSLGERKAVILQELQLQ